MCACNDGFIWDDISETCVNAGSCFQCFPNSSMTKLNRTPDSCYTPGRDLSQEAWMCACDEGFIWDDVSETCVDQGSCFQCFPNSTMTKLDRTPDSCYTPGRILSQEAWMCACNEGFIWDDVSETCVDQGSCFECFPNSSMTKLNRTPDSCYTPGRNLSQEAWMCACNEGFIWDDVSETCIDDNSCFQCFPNSTMKKLDRTPDSCFTPGRDLSQEAWMCVCDEGFIWHDNNDSCVELDACN